MAGHNKISEVEKEERIDIVMQLLSRFMSRRQILQYIAKKTDWGINSRQVDNYIAEAKEKLKEQENPEVIKGKIKSNFEMLLKKNLEIDDYREARAVLESMSKLLGVNAPDKHEHSGKDGQPIFNGINLKID